jgi:hypothetical protein
VIAPKLQTVRNCFKYGKEVEGLLDPKLTILEVDDVGLTVLDGLGELDKGGRVHITFWDRKLRGRELLCKRVAERWLAEFDLDFLYTSIPVGFRPVLAFCKRVGFVECGEDEGGVRLGMFRKDFLLRANSAGGLGLNGH